MADRSSEPWLAGPGMMLFSAALFGFFGFTTTWVYTSTVTGKFLLFIALLDWTLKGSAIAFLAAAVLTFLKPVAGNLLYCLVGLVGAALFVVVVVMDALDTTHAAMSPMLLLIFAAWNGFGSWTGLRAVMRGREMSDGR